MPNSYKPAIVVAAFNRMRSVQRILASLDKAVYPDDTQLVISIDNDGTNQDVYQFAENYNWRYGKKKVIYHSEWLGLREHILRCGELANQYGSVIILEEDIYVAPLFYKYACEAINYYASDNRIAGVSLYRLPYVEGHKAPFVPFDDGTDVFFIQMAGSIGQIWTSEHWNKFKEWYDTKPDLSQVRPMSEIIKAWPDSSWKKYFAAYVILFNKYFVFPKRSYVTNFADAGTNMVSKTFVLQVPLTLHDYQPKFVGLDDSDCVYDSYTEMMPDRLVKFNQNLKKYDFELDLYGEKEMYVKDYVLTTRKCKNIIMSFDRNMKPHEMNVMFGLPGTAISFARKEDVLMRRKKVSERLSDYNYFYITAFTTTYMFKIMISRFITRMKNFFK
ncbi:MAG: hypothetical protein K9G76_12490 [Bacteroidales bacterium]|nr:hypothetical protein [Bacteroidales bacterium]MCF8405348.1 hypothetical protein [Bacteroidales bacterium]